MEIKLRERTIDTVKIYYSKTQDTEIKKFLPQKAASLDEALEDFKKSTSNTSTSYGRTIYANGIYVGDVWCYCIHEQNEPEAMISYCMFEKALWGQGVATKALDLFIKVISEKFKLKSIGAFTYSKNLASIKILITNGFCKSEEFEDNGVKSEYYQLNIR